MQNLVDVLPLPERTQLSPFQTASGYIPHTTAAKTSYALCLMASRTKWHPLGYRTSTAFMFVTVNRWFLGVSSHVSTRDCLFRNPISHLRGLYFAGSWSRSPLELGDQTLG